MLTTGDRLQDPFEEYQTRLKARLARQDQSDEAVRRRAEAAAERDKDRTTWLGTDLGTKGETKADKEKRKRREEDEAGLVGKYLQAQAKKGSGGQATATTTTTTTTAPVEFGQEKKKKKGGGFGDFSGW